MLHTFGCPVCHCFFSGRAAWVPYSFWRTSKSRLISRINISRPRLPNALSAPRLPDVGLKAFHNRQTESDELWLFFIIFSSVFVRSMQLEECKIWKTLSRFISWVVRFHSLSSFMGPGALGLRVLLTGLALSPFNIDVHGCDFWEHCCCGFSWYGAALFLIVSGTVEVINAGEICPTL